MTTLRQLGEEALVALLTSAFATDRPLEVGAGDDGAVFDPGTRRQVAAADAMLEGVHFVRDLCPPRTIGRKLVAVNVSDIAAMGGEVDVALFTVGLPGETPLAEVRELIEGVAEESRRWGLSIIGGDVTGSTGPIALSLTILGRCEGTVMTRAGARPGDDIWLTRALGGAALGLRALRQRRQREAPEAVTSFLLPAPEVDKARALAAWPGVHAAMDVSDGLLPDAGRMARAAGVTLEIDLDCVPCTPEAASYGVSDPLALALHGGEDYALLFTGVGVPPVEAVRIGTVLEGPPLVRWVRGGRVVEPPSDGGFDHFG